MNNWVCRECGISLAGVAHLRLGDAMPNVRSPKGTGSSKGLCLTCVDKAMAKLHTPTLHEFVPAFVRAAAPPRPTSALRAMEERVKQLEQMLTDPRALELMLERATTPNTVRKIG